MPITHFNFQFEKEGARRIALAEQPRPERSVLATMLYIHGSHFSMLSPSVLSMGKIVVGRKIGGESATSPPSQCLWTRYNQGRKNEHERGLYGLPTGVLRPLSVLRTSFPVRGKRLAQKKGCWFW